MSELDDGQAGLALMISQFNELLAPVIEAAAGHMAKAKSMGFNEESSSRMGADYHQLLMQVVRNQAFGKPA